MVTPTSLLPGYFHAGSIKTPAEALDVPTKKLWELADHWTYIP